MGILKDSTDRLLKKNRRRTGLQYCGKFRSLFRGWCGCSYVGLFRSSKEVFICEECLSKNLSRLTKECTLRGN